MRPYTQLYLTFGGRATKARAHEIWRLAWHFPFGRQPFYGSIGGVRNRAWNSNKDSVSLLMFISVLLFVIFSSVNEAMELILRPHLRMASPNDYVRQRSKCRTFFSVPSPLIESLLAPHVPLSWPHRFSADIASFRSRTAIGKSLGLLQSVTQNPSDLSGHRNYISREDD